MPVESVRSPYAGVIRIRFQGNLSTPASGVPLAVEFKLIECKLEEGRRGRNADREDPTCAAAAEKAIPRGPAHLPGDVDRSRRC